MTLIQAPKLCVVGYGRWGSRVATCIANSAFVRLTHVVSRNQQLAAALSEAGVRRLEDVQPMLGSSDIDAVWVATPPKIGKQIALEALLSKKHVLLEKPLDRACDVDLLYETAQSVQRAFVVGYTSRFDPCVQSAIHCSSRVTHYVHTWRKWGSFDTGIIPALVSHDISVCARLFDLQAGQFYQGMSDDRDTYMGRWLFPNAVAEAMIDRRAKAPSREMRLTFADGSTQICCGHPAGTDALSEQLRFFAHTVQDPTLSWREHLMETLTAKTLNMLETASGAGS